jgi:hypothetical protein
MKARHFLPVTLALGLTLAGRGTASEPARDSTSGAPPYNGAVAQPASQATAAAAASPAAPKNLSYALNEVARMAEAGVGEQVLLTYVEQSKYIRFPTVDEILYLRSRGVPDNVIAAILKRDQTPWVAAAPAPAAAPTPPAATPTYTPPPAPASVAPTVVYTQPATVYVEPAPVYVSRPAISFSYGFNYGYGGAYFGGAYCYPRPVTYAGYPYRYGSFSLHYGSRRCW